MDNLKLFETYTQYDDVKDTFEYPTVSHIEDDVVTKYIELIEDVNHADCEKMYFTTRALESGTFTITIAKNVDTTNLTSISYSTDDGNTWTTTNNVTNTVVTITTPTVNAGDEVLWKGTARRMAQSDTGSVLSSTCRFDVYGNLLSLLHGDNFVGKKGVYYGFNFSGFMKNSKVVNARDLIIPDGPANYASYQMMFMNCTNLIVAPKTIKITYATGSGSTFWKMFYGCTNLIVAPELIQFAHGDDTKTCYYMFYNCRRMKTVPEIVVTESMNENEIILPQYCFYGMFQNCCSITRAPELPWLTLTKYCYVDMFKGCSSLRYIKMLATDISATDCLTGWVKNVSSTGTFIQNSEAQWYIIGPNGIPLGWTLEYEGSSTDAQNYHDSLIVDDPESKYLKTTARTPGTVTFTIGKNVSLSEVNYIEYKVNDGDWSRTDNVNNVTVQMTTPELQTGDVVTWRGSSSAMGTNSGDDYTSSFSSTCKFDVSGDLLSLLNESLIPTLSTYCFTGLFRNCTNLVNANQLSLQSNNLANNYYMRMFQGCTSLLTPPELPATQLTSACYYGMFNGCSSLTTVPTLHATEMKQTCYCEMFKNCTSLTVAPTLPATSLADFCYSDMFNGCTSLTSTPVLSAMTLFDYCYQFMFANCTSLTAMPTLPATTMKSNCYRNMFNGCTSLITTNTLPATTLAQSCYAGMFKNCTSLITAPELPAMTMAYNCYGGDDLGMFQGCTSLTVAPELPAITLAKECYRCMFQGCTSLTVAPELSATTLADHCYRSMFYGCTSLTTAPELRVTTLKQYCYRAMFNGCTSLTTAPELPATTLDVDCYSNMFFGCTSLTEAPELPATTLATYCYAGMFHGCTSLTEAPELPATTLANYCYGGDSSSNYGMFSNCTSLTVAPELPATTLAPYCYMNMFRGCTSLTTAPELPATTLVNQCYRYMFMNCTKLNYVNAAFTTVPSSTYTLNWLSGVASSGIFVKNPEATWNVTGVNGIPSGWILSSQEWEDDTVFDYFTMTATDDSVFTLSIASEISSNDFRYIEYSTDDGSTWIKTNNVDNQQVNVTTPTVTAGNSVKWRGFGLYLAKIIGGGQTKYSKFSSTGRYDVSGNIMSLVGGYNTLNTRVFHGLFTNSTNLVNANQLSLPCTTLSSGCYFYMFSGCTSLVTTPTLPAMSMDNGSYFGMFRNCTSLITAPSLPATSLANQCYSYMFEGCTSLVNAPELPALRLASSCYSGMFRNCTSLVTTPIIRATSLEDNCYAHMFYGCTNLTTAPSLRITTLKIGCYEYMFYNCRSLTNAPALPATTLTQNCYMFMFYGCTGLTQAPELPATTLVQNCYNYMFYGCTSLNHINASFLTTPSDTYTQEWVTNVATSGTFIKNKSANWNVTGTNGIPQHWIVRQNTDVEKIGMWVDDFPGLRQIDDDLDDYEGDGYNRYQYTGNTMTYDNKTCYIWEETEGNWEYGAPRYMLTSTNQLADLQAQSIYDKNTYFERHYTKFTSLIAFMREDMSIYSDIERIESTKIIYSVGLHVNGQDRPIVWVNNYESVVTPYDLNYPEINCYNYYVHYGDTIEYDSETCYVWENYYETGGPYYILTDTINYNELSSQSLMYDLSATFDSFVAAMDEDNEILYTSDYDWGEDLRLIRMEHNHGPSMVCWIDEFVDNGSGEIDHEPINAVIQSTLQDPASRNANKYGYYGDTIEYNGDEYYLWKGISFAGSKITNTNDAWGCLLTTTVDYNTLRNQSIEVSGNNAQFNALYAMMNDDLTWGYEGNNNHLRAKQLVKIYRV